MAERSKFWETILHPAKCEVGSSNTIANGLSPDKAIASNSQACQSSIAHRPDNTTLPPPSNTLEIDSSSSPSTKAECLNTTSSLTAQAKRPTLRTAPRRVKRPPSLPKPGESSAHLHARLNHNLVEQKYRHRLQARFKALLDVLPEGLLKEDWDKGEQPSTSSSGATKGGSKVDVGRPSDGGAGAIKGKNNRRMSKVDVLTKAEKVIRFLESDIENMEKKIKAMKREKTMAAKNRVVGVERVRQDHRRRYP
ncbi:hypothetical protein B0J18DRAFT_437106 [Chaetomium sp. MPI-SDFR-AT-0129]|nr:hypothetical protein B0J18DRAFT_437106 [Chaetomium sp. MPI-SDFR-AT-0129]